MVNWNILKKQKFLFDNDFSKSFTLFEILYPIFSNISAEPDFELTERLPCFATVTPALAATIAALVDMFKVSFISPPVPQVSIVF